MEPSEAFEKFRDEAFLAEHTLSPTNVLDYFSNSKYFDPQSLNQQRRRGVPVPPGADGIEFRVIYSNPAAGGELPPHLKSGTVAGTWNYPNTFGVFVIQKFRKEKEQELPMDCYYIIGGTLYKAPQLAVVVRHRLALCFKAMEKALDSINDMSYWSLTNGYQWGASHAVESDDESDTECYTRSPIGSPTPSSSIRSSLSKERSTISSVDGGDALRSDKGDINGVHSSTGSGPGMGGSSTGSGPGMGGGSTGGGPGMGGSTEAQAAHGSGGAPMGVGAADVDMDCGGGVGSAGSEAGHDSSCAAVGDRQDAAKAQVYALDGRQGAVDDCSDTTTVHNEKWFRETYSNFESFWMNKCNNIIAEDQQHLLVESKAVVGGRIFGAPQNDNTLLQGDQVPDDTSDRKLVHQLFRPRTQAAAADLILTDVFNEFIKRGTDLGSAVAAERLLCTERALELQKELAENKSSTTN